MPIEASESVSAPLAMRGVKSTGTIAVDLERRQIDVHIHGHVCAVAVHRHIADRNAVDFLGLSGAQMPRRNIVSRIIVRFIDVRF